MQRSLSRDMRTDGGVSSDPDSEVEMEDKGDDETSVKVDRWDDLPPVATKHVAALRYLMSKLGGWDRTLRKGKWALEYPGGRTGKLMAIQKVRTTVGCH